MTRLEGKSLLVIAEGEVPGKRSSHAPAVRQMDTPFQIARQLALRGNRLGPSADA
jgi:hypothetical protein